MDLEIITNIVNDYDPAFLGALTTCLSAGVILALEQTSSFCFKLKKGYSGYINADILEEQDKNSHTGGGYEI